MVEIVSFETAEVHFGKWIVVVSFNDPKELHIYCTMEDYIDISPILVVSYQSISDARKYASIVAKTGKLTELNLVLRTENE